MKVEMVPVCQLVWDATAFEHEICPNPRLTTTLPMIVKSIKEEGYRMNGDGVLQVTRLADKYLVITGRLQAIAAAMCKVKEVPVLVYPEDADLRLMRYTTCTPKRQERMGYADMVPCAKYMITQGATKKDLYKTFGPYYGHKLVKELLNTP